ncbi:MAG TPA: sugar transferase, partial [Candidatus Cybelea sp.]|nr:sugar transferase [Candidatus Cybelea sp.]
MSNSNRAIQSERSVASQETPDVNQKATPVAHFPLWKRVLDVTLVLLALPCLLPVGIMIAIFIKIASPGPYLFRQWRVGHKRRKFMCLKFRT